jgi:hypothetical protein
LLQILRATSEMRAELYLMKVRTSFRCCWDKSDAKSFRPNCI